MSIDLALLSDSLSKLVASASPSIVRVEARAHRPSSGVVYADKGLILTANHALERDEPITVHTHDGASHPAKLIGRDAGTDLAVLEVAATLDALRFSDADGVKVGQLVLAVGRPGKTARATSGIVSAFGESYRTQHNGRIDHYLESDADLRPGFSGGALVATSGAALGVVTGAIVRGVMVAIPTATVARVVGELGAHGRVRRGYLGVGSYPVRLAPSVAASVGKHEGAVIVAVEPDGPADRAGLLQGDVLLSIDGVATAHPAQVAAALEDKADVDVRVELVRGGALITRTVKTGHRR
jgi:serine protease DegQ